MNRIALAAADEKRTAESAKPWPDSWAKLVYWDFRISTRQNIFFRGVNTFMHEIPLS
jgi:hypothetical protein